MLQQTNFPLSEPATFCFIGKGKGNVDLYSTSSRMSLTSSDMDHIVLPANITISAFTRKHSHVAPPHICIANAPEFNLLLIYRPEEDEWLSSPCWLTYSGRLPRGGHLSTASLGAGQGKFACHRPTHCGMPPIEDEISCSEFNMFLPQGQVNSYLYTGATELQAGE